MHVHETRTHWLLHVPAASSRTGLYVQYSSRRCLHCGHEHKIPIQFQAPHRRDKLHLERYIEDLLELGLTLREIQENQERCIRRRLDTAIAKEVRQFLSRMPPYGPAGGCILGAI